MAVAAACSPARRDAPMPRSVAAQFGHLAFDVKGLLVGGAQGADHPVLRQFHLAPLQPFLQLGFRILGGRLHAGVDLHGLEQPVHQGLRRAIAGVQVNGANHRLQGVGQDRGPLLPTRAGLALTQPDHVGQAQLHRQMVQRVLLDQVGPHTREIALGLVAQAAVQQAGHGQVEHGIAQKLQPLVVIGRKAAVRGGPQQQLRVGKGVLQARLQFRQTRLHAYLDWPAYLRVR